MTHYAYRSNPLFFFCHQEGCCASSFSSPLSVSTSTALAVKNMSSECGERQQWQQGGVAKSLSSVCLGEVDLCSLLVDGIKVCFYM